MKFFRQHRVHLSASCALILLGQIAEGNADFTYFSQPELDFWKEGSAKASGPQPPARTKQVQTTKPSPASNGSGFAWQKYLDPKNDEFFREGEYLPPAPFMEIARNPTDSNIENWFRYLEQKNQLMHRLQERLSAFAASRGNPATPEMAVIPTDMARTVDDAPRLLMRAANQLPASPPPRADAKRFRLRLYFDSHCPHCEHMLSTTIPELTRLGYWIELRQVDRDESIRAKIPIPVISAPPAELKRYSIESVPVLLIGDLKARSFFKMQGYQSAGTVITALQTPDKKRQW